MQQGLLEERLHIQPNPALLEQRLHIQNPAIGLANDTQLNGAWLQVDPKPDRVDKHTRKRAKEARFKAKREERERRHEAKMNKMQQRAEAAVRLLAARVKTHTQIILNNSDLYG